MIKPRSSVSPSTHRPASPIGLRRVPAAPSDALDRLAIEAAPGLALVSRGTDPGPLAPAALAEAGAALAVALRDGPVPTIVDAGTAETPAARALVEVADVSLVVVRECYLALRRAVRIPLVARASGVAVLEEPGRALGAKEVTDVVGLPLAARVPVREAIARCVDAGTMGNRLPESLGRAATDALRAVGLSEPRRGAAA